MSKVVLLDDDILIVRMMASAFEAYKIDFSVYERGNDFLKEIDKVLKDCHIFICDAILQDSSSREIMTKVKKEYPQVKVFLASGYTEGYFDLDKTLYDEFLNKPFNVTDLMQKIKDFEEENGN